MKDHIPENNTTYKPLVDDARTVSKEGKSTFRKGMNSSNDELLSFSGGRS